MGILLKLLNLSKVLRIRLYPAINRALLRSKGAVLGKRIHVIGRISVTTGVGSQIEIGDDFYFSSGDSINPICANLQGAMFLEPGARLVIGNNVGMSSTRFWIHDGITIGNNVKIGGCVLICDTDCHPIDYTARRHNSEGTLSAPIYIEDDAWIGAHCIILKGVTIGARSIIGAGSIVTRSVPADCMAAGNPCRIIRRIDGEAVVD